MKFMVLGLLVALHISAGGIFAAFYYRGETTPSQCNPVLFFFAIQENEY